MDFKQLRSFIALVDYRSFSRAGEKLYIAQSTVSSHLAQLEKELDTKLIHRTTKSIEVTEAGWKVYKYASQILEMESYVYESCTDHPRRVIRIAATGIPSTYLLPGVLQQYRELYQNDHLKVTQLTSGDVIEGVRDCRFDAGLIGQAVRKSELKCVPVCHNRMVLITPVSEHYLNLQQNGASVGELLKNPIIALEEGDEKGTDHFLVKMGMDLDDLRIAAKVNDLEAVKNMVASGLGIAIIPEIAAHDFLMAHRILKFDVLKYQVESMIYLIYPDHYTTKDYAWNFIDYLLESNEFTFRTK